MKIADPIEVNEADLAGLWRLRWAPVEDDRGSLLPLYIESQLNASPLPQFAVKQANVTRSQRAVIRGVHGEHVNKLTVVLAGRIFAATVDLRPDSATFERHVTFELGPNEGLFLSSGLGNAFQSVSVEDSLFLYMLDAEWQPGMPGRHVNPLDHDLGIDWPIRNEVVLSEKDRSLPGLRSGSRAEP